MPLQLSNLPPPWFVNLSGAEKVIENRIMERLNQVPQIDQQELSDKKFCRTGVILLYF